MSDMAVAAGKRALENAGLKPEDIDLLVVATMTADMPMPAAACIIQHKLGLPSHTACFDINAACTGFVYALDTGCAMLSSGRYQKALIIGAEKLSPIVDWQDRTTCVLFGDGAGAVVLEAQQGQGTIRDRGVLTTHLRSDGRHREKLYVDGGPSSTGTVGHLRMSGREVFRHAVSMVTDVMTDAFAATGTSAEDLDWFVPHQANRRIIDASAEKLHIAPAKIVVTVEDHGNTSAASIPLALATAVGDGRIKPGQLVMIEAMGGGFTWGSALIRW
jgi:3-oxoacyl-[acyl-carrier-protein] synthase-3